jgi:hypothetical protein
MKGGEMAGAGTLPLGPRSHDASGSEAKQLAVPVAVIVAPSPGARSMPVSTPGMPELVGPVVAGTFTVVVWPKRPELL